MAGSLLDAHNPTSWCTAHGRCHPPARACARHITAQQPERLYFPGRSLSNAGNALHDFDAVAAVPTRGGGGRPSGPPRLAIVFFSPRHHSSGLNMQYRDDCSRPSRWRAYGPGFDKQGDDRRRTRESCACFASRVSASVRDFPPSSVEPFRIRKSIWG
jgi:hypothetical protein